MPESEPSVKESPAVRKQTERVGENSPITPQVVLPQNLSIAASAPTPLEAESSESLGARAYTLGVDEEPGERFCRVCGERLTPRFLQEYPDARICSRRRCYYIELARKTPQRAALLALLPRRYQRARLNDFTHKGVSYLRETLRDRGSVFLSGTQGIGKTHLAAALVNSLLVELASERGYEVLWVRSTDLLLELQSCFGGKGDMRGVINKYKRCELLVLDDFGAERISEWSLSAIYSILAERVDELRATIVTSNLNLDVIDEFEPRLASRLAEFATLTLPSVDRRLCRE